MIPPGVAHGRSEKGLHPNSLKNLRRGGVPSSPIVRQQRARKAGLARAAKAMTEIERRVLREYGLTGLAAFRLGLKVQKNRQYQVMRKAT